MDHQTLDPQRQQQAKQYAKIRRQFMLLDLALGAVMLLVWLLVGWSFLLRDWIFSWTQNQWIAVVVFGAVFGAVFSLLDLPLSYYTGYVLPHRYQQSNQTLKGWWGDLIKSLLLSAVIGGFLLEVLYLILRTASDTWWLWTAGFLLLFNVILANLAPVLLFPIFYKFLPLDEEHLDLQERLISLAEKAGTNVAGVFKFDMSRRTKAANAGLTGLGNTRRIILGDTLLKEFSPDEIETVLAHELGHHANHDIPLGMAVQTVITLGGLYLTSRGLSWGINRFGFESISDIAALPLFGLFLGVFGLITMPLSNGFSRWREQLADEFALQLTGKGFSYASALTRLSNQNLAEVDPEPWIEFFLHSHPALEKRILRAQSYKPENR
ncbi:MAG: M48 family metallopeptidase [Anaerolineales bacterium]|nr:M48 family metallopeptidase [Anaerolineales bacterium]